MEEAEIRAAASSAAKLKGYDRITFIQNSYPAAYWADILQLAAQIKSLDICLYNGIGRDII